MLFSYAKRAFEILWARGAWDLLFSIHNFLKHRKRKINVEINRKRLKKEYGVNVIPKKNRTYGVPVQDINSSIRTGTVKRYFQGGIPASPVWKGEWDKLETRPIPQSHVYKSFVDRFKYGKDWEKTVYYERLMGDQNRSSNRAIEYLQSKQHPGVIRYLEKYDSMYEDMKLNGFNNNHPIRTVITRNGGYLIWDGLHRTTMAKLLNFKTIPVKIRAIHSNWLELRDDMYNNNISVDNNNLRKHPDMQDIID